MHFHQQTIAVMPNPVRNGKFKSVEEPQKKATFHWFLPYSSNQMIAICSSNESVAFCVIKQILIRVKKS